MNDTKEVYFHLWCQTCKHSGADEEDKHCSECLNYSMNIDSHKPVNWEEKE